MLVAMLTVPLNANGQVPAYVKGRAKESVFLAVWSSVPPSSIVRDDTANAPLVHCVMSSVPPAWIVTGTGCEEMALCSTMPDVRDELITTVPPKISTPRSMRWSV